MKQRILIVAEAVTLAHVARPLALAKIFEELGHEVIIACSASAGHWMESEGKPFITVDSISRQQFLHALHHGNPLYDAATLERYVEADVALMERVRPSFVIGDFRLSLYMSSKLAGLRYGNITNAYWSPRYFRYAEVPDIGLTRVVGVKPADTLFRGVYRLAFAWHARPYAKVARRFGVAPAPGGLLGAYTASDCTAYADLAELYGAPQSPAPKEIFVGPLQWSPRVVLPAGHERWGEDRPLVYVTLGSSGPPKVLQKVLAALSRLRVDVVAATAGAPIESTPPNVTLLEYAPGDELCARAALVVGNGGSPTTYQALAAGKPVLGLASNMDQFLNMRALGAQGASLTLRADLVTVDELAKAMVALLSDPSFGVSANRVARALAAFDRQEQVADWVARLANI